MTGVSSEVTEGLVEATLRGTNPKRSLTTRSASDTLGLQCGDLLVDDEGSKSRLFFFT